MTDNFERALEERLLARSQVSPRDVEALRLFARTLPTRRGFWSRPVMRFALSAAAVLVAAVVALPVILNNIPGPGATPSPTSPAPTSPAPTSPAPTTPVGTPVPSIGIGVIRLLTASGSAIDVHIEDPDGLLVGAVAEQAEATMSVRWGDSIVEQVSPTAIRVTWAGFSRDESLLIEVRDADGAITVDVLQDMPPPLSDAMGEDRVLVLELSDPIDANNVMVTVAEPAID